MNFNQRAFNALSRLLAGCAVAFAANCALAQSAEVQSVLSTLPASQAAQVKSVLDAMSPQDIQRATQQFGGDKAAGQARPSAAPAEKLRKKNAPMAAEASVTGFANRTILRPFGESLMSGEGADAHVLDIPVPGDYKVGPGDTVLLQLFGKDNRSYSLPITRDGILQIPEIGPLSVSGMTFESMSATLIDRISKQKIGVEASVTMGPLRSIQVFLVGDVNKPGAYTMPALATVTNTLLAAGGVRQSGSLRRIEVRRHGRTLSHLDLYDVLLKGNVSADLRLQPSDVIFVPPVGTRVGISGEVNRPAIYELLNETTAADLVQLAGGLLPTAFAGGSKLHRLLPDDTRRVEDVSLANGMRERVKLHNGDIIDVPVSVEAIRGGVHLAGAVVRPGPYAWHSGMQLADLLSSPRLLDPRAWRLLALVERRDAITGLGSFIPVNLIDVLQKRASFSLSTGDLVYVFDDRDIDFLSSASVQNALKGKTMQGACPAVGELASIVMREGVDRFRAALVRDYGESVTDARSCPPLFVQAPKLLTAMLEYSSIIRGEVKSPGFVTAAPGLSLADAITVLGGYTGEADEDKIELSRQVKRLGGRSGVERKLLKAAETASLRLQGGDIVVVRKRFNELDNGAVTLRGEIISPGTFDIRRGERLSEVLLRAGGLTNNAYPYGAVFQRVRVREEKRAFYQRASIEMQNSLLMMLTRQKRTASSGTDTAAAMKGLADEMKKIEPSGRVVVEADPSVLQVHPELDVVLEPGDEIYVPKRPSHVVVMGEVLNPGALQFRSGFKAEDYLRAAGGTTQTGDESRVYMILPNGSAEPLKLASWNTQPTVVPPGSVIYVPRGPLPLDGMDMFQAVLEIAKDVALTAASLYSITK